MIKKRIFLKKKKGPAWTQTALHGSKKTAPDTRGCLYIQTCQCAAVAVIVVVAAAWGGPLLEPDVSTHVNL